MAIYLKESFDDDIISGECEKAVKIYDVSDDDRQELFENDLSSLLGMLHQSVLGTGSGSEAALEVLHKADDYIPSGKSVQLSSTEGTDLTDEQSSAKTLIGYSMAFITLGFLFCGV